MRLQGQVQQDLEHEAGDFIVQRADGVFAYHLAPGVFARLARGCGAALSASAGRG